MDVDTLRSQFTRSIAHNITSHIICVLSLLAVQMQNAEDAENIFLKSFLFLEVDDGIFLFLHLFPIPISHAPQKNDRIIFYASTSFAWPGSGLWSLPTSPRIPNFNSRIKNEM